MKWILRAQRNLLRQTVDVYTHVRTPDGSIGAVTHMQVREVEPGTELPDTPVHLDNEQAQQLIDDLYRAGFRPTDAQGTAGQLEAMKAHLDDMRKSYEMMLAYVKVQSQPMIFVQDGGR
jgi:hypothetical protein